MKSKLLFSICAVLGVLGIYVGHAVLNMAKTYELSSPKQTYPLLSWSEYRSIASDVEPPILLEAELGAGAVLFFGAEHSNDPSHPQFAELDAAFQRFKPTVVLVEGRPGPIFRPFMEATESYGESGRLVALAQDVGIGAYIWELSREEEVALLQERFSAEQVAIYLLIRPFPGGNSRADAETALAAILDDRGGRPGIDGVIASLDEFKAAWNRNLATGEDWRDLNGLYGAPGFLSEMFEYGNDIRDQHLLNIVREQSARGERVMATMGWSHTVRVEPALTQLDPAAR